MPWSPLFSSAFFWPKWKALALASIRAAKLERNSSRPLRRRKEEGLLSLRVVGVPDQNGCDQRSEREHEREHERSFERERERERERESKRERERENFVFNFLWSERHWQRENSPLFWSKNSLETGKRRENQRGNLNLNTHQNTVFVAHHRTDIAVIAQQKKRV